MKRLSSYSLYAVGALAALIGFALTLSPVDVPIIPELPNITLADAGRSVEGGTAEALAARFDLSDLPPAEPPPADPAQHLRTFKFLGMASSGDRVRAMFADATGPVTLKPGDELAGYALTSVEPARARFLKDGVEVELIVNSP